MGSYKLTHKARADLKRIWLYGVQTHGETRADHYHRDLLERCSLIADQPYMFQAVDDIRPGYRRSVYGTDCIYYRINNDMVEIMAILGRQSVDDWL